MKKLTVLVLVVLLGACATVREKVIDVSDQDVANIKTAEQVAGNLLKTWPFKSGLIRKGLGTKMNELPFQAVQAMDELDTLAERYNDGFDLCSQDKGAVVGLHLRLLQQTVAIALEQFAPEILSTLTKIGLGL